MTSSQHTPETQDFDHTQYRDEVIDRWGEDSYRTSDSWWRGMTDQQRAAWMSDAEQLGRDWIAAFESGADPLGELGQALAARHADWLRSIPGTPLDPQNLPGYMRGLGEMYVADERFAVNYGGSEGAAFVRDALTAYADTL